ncbi:uncharacterized protein AAES06_017278 isoform 2-T2 [Glossophaga mutica]
MHRDMDRAGAAPPPPPLPDSRRVPKGEPTRRRRDASGAGKATGALTSSRLRRPAAWRAPPGSPNLAVPALPAPPRPARASPEQHDRSSARSASAGGRTEAGAGAEESGLSRPDETWRTEDAFE